MNNSVVANILRFIILVVVQVLLLDQINLLGFIKPYIYLLFIVLYPVRNNRTLFLLVAFGLGLVIDVFSDTGGAHAAACMTLAFLRPYLFKLVYGEAYKLNEVNVMRGEINRMILLLVLCTGLHHLLLFVFILFDFSHSFLFLKLWSLNGLATFLLGLVVLIIFKPKERL
ncbi:MAG: rod shape-determining protein MreD [Nonlabens sp.]